MAHAREAVDVGADVIVAQGGEAGGHGGNRSTLTLVPEVADFLADVAPDTLLVAAGGVADGRGLAAAMMLGADGVLIGSRLVASSDAAALPGFHDAIVAADGDSTIKTTVIDIVRYYEWPDEFRGRALKNRFVTAWHGREGNLAEPSTNAAENERYLLGRSCGIDPRRTARKPYFRGHGYTGRAAPWRGSTAHHRVGDIGVKTELRRLAFPTDALRLGNKIRLAVTR